VSLRQYVDGLLGDSPRKSMSAMLARVTEPGSYQALQHFITDAPWDAEAVWRRVRAVLPERRGILILDETSFPKQGPHSVGVARQYCGALGKVANCQVAVTAALWTGRRAWPLGALLYLPDTWATDPARRLTTRIPTAVRFQEKWRLALTLLRRSRAAGLHVTAVVADAEYGDNRTLRQALHRAKLPYALGISPTLTVFLGTPTLRVARRHAPPRKRREGWPDHEAVSVRVLSDLLPTPLWRRVAWRNGTNPPWAADFAAVRVTPASDWRHRRLAPEVWLLCERGLGSSTRTKYYLIALPASASLQALVRLAHQRWAIEQHYQHLKTELGVDHFEGRTYPGWQHHVVISAVAYAFLQKERMRGPVDAALTFPALRAIVQEVFTGLLFASRPTYVTWLHEAQAKYQLRI
jgi:SRSO17 transposase